MTALAGMALIPVLGFGAGRNFISPKSTTPKQVCVLPTDAQMVKAGIKGGQGLVKESEEWADRLNSAMTAAAKSAQLSVVPMSADPAHEEAAQEAERQVKQKYDTIWPLLRNKPKDVTKDRYSIGDVITLLPCAAEADTIVLVRANAILQTGGKKTFNILTSGAASFLTARAQSTIYIALLDARTGDVRAVRAIYSIGGGSIQDPTKAYTDDFGGIVKSIGKPRK